MSSDLQKSNVKQNKSTKRPRRSSTPISQSTPQSQKLASDSKFFAYKSPKFMRKGKTDLKSISFSSLDEMPCAYYDDFLHKYAHFNPLSAETRPLPRKTLPLSRRISIESSDGENSLNVSVSAEQFGREAVVSDSTLQSALVALLGEEDDYDEALEELRAASASSRWAETLAKENEFVKSPFAEFSRYQAAQVRAQVKALQSLARETPFREYPNEETAALYGRAKEVLEAWKADK